MAWWNNSNSTDNRNYQGIILDQLLNDSAARQRIQEKFGGTDESPTGLNIPADISFTDLMTLVENIEKELRG